MELEIQWDGNPSIILDIKTRVGVVLPVQVTFNICIFQCFLLCICIHDLNIFLQHSIIFIYRRYEYFLIDPYVLDCATYIGKKRCSHWGFQVDL